MDYAEFYAKVSKPFRGKIASRCFSVLDDLLVGVFIAEYISTLFLVGYYGHYLQLGFDLAKTPESRPGISLLAAVAVPLATLLIVSFLRAKLNKPRPYVADGISPILARRLLDERKSGKSFPSRHMACAVIVAVTFCLARPSALSISVQVLLCLGIAFTRIVGGVHYPRDILAAIAIALACALVGFAITP